jgi:hypothetical protein
MSAKSPSDDTDTAQRSLDTVGIARRKPVNQPDSYERLPADERDRTLPNHLIQVRNPNQDAVCRDCGNWIVVTTDRTELGHRRGVDAGSERCEHRPECVETTTPRVRGGGE